MVKRTRRNIIQGDGFFGDLWRGVKKAANWVKDNKILSTVGSVVPIPAVQNAAKIAGMAGLGRKRKTAAKSRAKAHPSKRKPRAHPSKTQYGGASGAIALHGVRSSARSGLRL